MPASRFRNVKAPILHLLALVAIATSTASTARAIRFDDIRVESAADDTLDDGACTLREAILSANQVPANDDCESGSPAFVDTIVFAIGSGPRTIAPLTPLPEITGATILEGASQPGFQGSPLITLDGRLVLGAGDGLVFRHDDSLVRGLEIVYFPGDGVRIDAVAGEEGVAIGGSDDGEANHIVANRGAGVRIVAGLDHWVGKNVFEDNGGLAVDLAPEGPTPNDPLDADDGPNGLQNAPVIQWVLSNARETRALVAIDGRPSGYFALSLWANATCDPSGFGEGTTRLAVSESLEAGTDGHAEHVFVIEPPLAPTIQLTALATDKSLGSSEFSACVPVSAATISIPALDGVGLALLALGLGLVGRSRLNRAR
jgi:CSLREA domain-containing protein